MFKRVPSFLRHVGPGVVTGAADDDPSGIATYTQAGAQFGTGLLWTVFLTLPFMIAHPAGQRPDRPASPARASPPTCASTRPRWFLMALVALLVIANTINIAADIAAMGEALQLVVGGRRAFLFAWLLAWITVLLQVFVPYRKLAPILKWLTLYPVRLRHRRVHGARFPGARVLYDLVIPKLQCRLRLLDDDRGAAGHHDFALPVLLAGLAGSRRAAAARAAGHGSEAEIRATICGASGADTIVGMFFSNAIAFFIMVLGAAVLYAAGIDRRDLAPRRPHRRCARWLVNLPSVLFAGGIIATGLLAVPVLASSAAYAVAEAFGWPEGLERHWYEARRFYAIITIATVGRHRAGLHVHRPDEGALLERGDQRRGGRAHHGRR